MKKKDFISIKELTNEDVLDVFLLAAKLKKKKSQKSDELKGKSVGLLFQKPSNRTRVSFEVGIWQLGGNCIYLSPEEINLGKRESTADVAKTLSRYLDCIVARTNTHRDILDLAENASIPVINGLCDLYHPCQGLTDIFSIQEKFGRLKGITVAYIGDGNNVCHSLLLGCVKTGVHINIATPAGYEPNQAVLADAQKFAEETGSKILLTKNPQEAVQAAQVIYSDVWVSMGQETESQKRLKDFQDFQINRQLVSQADNDHIFMHCLPAHRDLEVTADVIDGEHSIVFDQAENRLHIQKAILIFLLAKIKGPKRTAKRI